MYNAFRHSRLALLDLLDSCNHDLLAATTAANLSATSINVPLPLFSNANLAIVLVAWRLRCSQVDIDIDIPLILVVSWLRRAIERVEGRLPAEEAGTCGSADSNLVVLCLRSVGRNFSISDFVAIVAIKIFWARTIAVIVGVIVSSAAAATSFVDFDVDLAAFSASSVLIFLFVSEVNLARAGPHALESLAVPALCRGWTVVIAICKVVAVAGHDSW